MLQQVDRRGRIVDCGWFRHHWDDGDSTCGTGCDTYSMMYTCRVCSKVKVVGGA